MKFAPLETEVLDCAIATVISACKIAFKDNLECVTLKGSAIKGDFIKGYSDLDFHVFIRSRAMEGERNPKVKYAILFQEAIGDIDPEDFEASQLQIYFINSKKYPAGWVPPVQGTYKVLLGNLPVIAREKSDSAYLRSARRSLLSVNSDRQMLIRRFVDKPNARVHPVVRLLGVTLKSHMYSIAILATSKPKIILRTNLDRLIDIVEKETLSKKRFSVFFEHISNWVKIQRDCDYARETFREGIEALDDIIRWNHRTP